MSQNLVFMVPIHQRSQKIVGTVPLYLNLTFSGTQSKGICFREGNCDTCDKNVTRDATFLELFLLNCIFYQKIGTRVVGRSFLKANNVFPCWSFFGKHYLA